MAKVLTFTISSKLEDNQEIGFRKRVLAGWIKDLLTISPPVMGFVNVTASSRYIDGDLRFMRELLTARIKS